MSSSTNMDIENNTPTTSTPPLPNNSYNYTSTEHLPPFPNSDYTEINLKNIEYLSNKDNDFILECMRITIGKEGANFKKITEKFKIAYIYHNIDLNTISIWGHRHKFKSVIKNIMNHIEWASNYLETKRYNINL